MGKKEGITLNRGNIHVHVSRETFEQGREELVQRLHAENQLFTKCPNDPEGYISYPDGHKSKQRVTPRWRGSGSTNGPVTSSTTTPHRTMTDAQALDAIRAFRAQKRGE